MHEKHCDPNITPQYGGTSRSVETEDGELKVHESFLRNTMHGYRLTFSSSPTELFERLQNALQQVSDQLKRTQEGGVQQRFYLSLQTVFYKPSDPSTVTDPSVILNSEVLNLLASTDIENHVELIYSNLLVQIDEYEGVGSGWGIDSFKLLDINFVNYLSL